MTQYKMNGGLGANGLGGNTFGRDANGQIWTRCHQFNILLQYMYLNTANIVEYKLNVLARKKRLGLDYDNCLLENGV